MPENCKIEKVEDIVHLMMFCNLDQHDIMTVDTLMRMFDYPKCLITLVPVMQRKATKIRDKIEALFSPNTSSEAPAVKIGATYECIITGCTPIRRASLKPIFTASRLESEKSTGMDHNL